MKVLVNGVHLFVEVLGPKLATAGSTMVERPTVVALHGGPSDHAHMMAMVEPLVDIAQIVLYDHRGCGRSEHGDPALWNMNQWADDVRGVCDALGIEKPIVYGHSFGGMVAQTYAFRHPGHAQKLILAGTGPRFDAQRSIEGFRRQGGDVAANAFAAWLDNPNPDTTAAFATNCRHLYTTSRKMNQEVAARTVTNITLLFDFFATTIKQFDVIAQLASVTTPTLILGGEEDPVMPPQYQEDLERALVNAPTRRVSFARCGHTLAGDAPRELAATLQEWVTP